MGRVARGASVLLLLFGAAFALAGQFLARESGPATSLFENLRRYEAALEAGLPHVAAPFGSAALDLADGATALNDTAIARLEHRLARAYLAAGQPERAAPIARQAALRLYGMRLAASEDFVAAARLDAESALAEGNGLGAACAFGLAIERMGAGRFLATEERYQPNPAYPALESALLENGKRIITLRDGRQAERVDDRILPSCHLAADVYVALGEIDAASAVSTLVLRDAAESADLSPEMHVALLGYGAKIEELRGDLVRAEALLSEAVTVIKASGREGALPVAEEALGIFLARNGKAAAALPLLEKAITREEAEGRADSPLLAEPLLALGYAQLDAGAEDAALASFERSLRLAKAAGAGGTGTAIEARNALADLQGRALSGDGADPLSAPQHMSEPMRVVAEFGRFEVSEEAPPNTGAPLMPILLLPLIIAETTGPAGSEPVFAEADVAFAGKIDDPRLRAWPETFFDGTSDHFSLPGILRTHETAPASFARDGLVLYFADRPGGKSRAILRAATLMSALGPKPRVMAVLPFEAESLSTAVLPDARRAAEDAGNIQRVFAGLGLTKSETPIAIIAEGSAADSLLLAIEALDAPTKAALERRLTEVAFVSPAVAEPKLKAFVSQLNKSEIPFTAYLDREPVALMAARWQSGGKGYAMNPERLRAVTKSFAFSAEAASDAIVEAGMIFTDFALLLQGGPALADQCTRMATADGEAVLTGDRCAGN